LIGALPSAAELGQFALELPAAEELFEFELDVEPELQPAAPASSIPLKRIAVSLFMYMSSLRNIGYRS
jgi:hypothetical protein